MIVLTPRVYKQNIKWAAAHAQKINTVQGQLLDNTLIPSVDNLYTQNVTTVAIGDRLLTLPIDNSIAPTHYRWMHNGRWVPFEDVDHAKARIECIMISGTATIHTDKAILNVPRVQLTLAGTSDVISRGGSAFDTYPSKDQLSDQSFSLAQWIHEHKTSTNESLTWSYENDSFSMNPWVRKLIPYDLVGMTAPGAGDILTTWNDPSQTARTWATASRWTDHTNYEISGAEIYMWPTNPQGSDIPSLVQCAIKMQDHRMGFGVSVTKVDDYNFKVNYHVPVRLAYAAASRTRGMLGAYYELDNWAFVDNITSINLSFSGAEYSDETIKYAYSMNAQGVLTEELKNEHILNIAESELLTKYVYTDKSAATNLYNSASNTVGKYVDNEGVLVDRTGAFVTDYIAVTPGQLIEASNCVVTGFDAPGLLYDANMLPISSIPVEEKNYVYGYKFIVPADCYYMRLNGDVHRAEVGTFFVRGYTLTFWHTQKLKDLLRKYKNGKYTVTCEVSMNWLVENRVDVGTEAQVILPDGQYISREKNVCTFCLKNITKHFKQDSFTCTLDFLEV